MGFILYKIMGKYIPSEELIGKVFNSLTVVEIIDTPEVRGRKLICDCICGKEITTTYSAVKLGNVKCECQLRVEQKSYIGNKYNMLTIESLDKDITRNVIVSCECGKTKSVEFRPLLLGKIKSCGCLTKSRPSAGEVYNMLTIIEDLPPKKVNRNRYKRVMAKCECGTVKEFDYKEIKKGNTKSCGCFAKGLRNKIQKGDIFSYWTIKEETEGYFYKGKKSDREFVCECICGKIKKVKGMSITSGKSKSCGCQGILPKEKIKKEQIPIPISTEDEQWITAFGFDGYYISTNGRIFSTKGTNKYLKTENKTTITLSSDGLDYRNLNIAKTVYKSFKSDWDNDEYNLIFIDDNKFNTCLDNLFLAKLTKYGTTWVSKVLNGTAYSSLRSGIEIIKIRTITKKDIIEQYLKQDGLSYFLKIPLDLIGEDRLKAISIDRIDNDKGYEPGNFTLVTRFENMGRGKNTIEDFQLLCNELSYIEK